VIENKVESQRKEGKPTNGNLAKKEEVVSWVKAGIYHLALVDRDGHCTLLHRKKDEAGREVLEEMDLRISAPCDFVRASWKNYEPLSYVYRKGSDRRTVFLITGGRPDPKVNDEFQPDGCGTALSKIRVFNNRVEVAWASQDGPPVCPSGGMEEVNFGT
jgi:hypothetical protein